MKFRSKVGAVIVAGLLVLLSGTASFAVPRHGDIAAPPTLTLQSTNSSSGNADIIFNYQSSPSYYLYSETVQGATVNNSINFSPSCNSDFRVVSTTEILIVARGPAACTFTVHFDFDLNKDAIDPTTRYLKYGYGISGPSITLQIPLSFTDRGKLDVSQSKAYTVDLGLNCDSLTTSSKLNCTMNPVATDSQTGQILSGTITLWACTYVQDSLGARDCRNQVSGSTSTSAVEKQTLSLQLGSTSNLTMKNAIYTSGTFFELDVYGDVGLLGSKTWTRTPSTPTYKSMSLRVSVPSQVAWGKTYKYSISASQKVSGTCALWRYYNGSLLKVAAPKLIKGAAAGNITWLWVPQGTLTPLSLDVVCTAGTFKGETQVMVSGYKP